MPQFRALMMDFGGVMTIPLGDAIGGYCAEIGVAPERFMGTLMNDGHVRDMHHLLERGEGISPAETMFVDDTQLNVTAARQAGMTALLHRTAEETIPQLESLLAVPLR